MTPTQAATFDPEPAAAPGQERTLVVAVPHAPRVAVFCTDERMLIEQAAQHLSAGLRAGGKVVALMDPGRLQQLSSLLAAEGHALEPLQRAGQLLAVDPQDLLSEFRADDESTLELLEQRVAELVAQSLQSLDPGQLMYAYNELPAALWDQGARTSAVEAEAHWEELQRGHGDRLCGAHAIGKFFKSSQAACARSGQPAATALSAAELVQRAEMEDARSEAIARSRAARRSLRRSEEQLSDFLENGALGPHRVGADGTILWANQAELELLRGSTERLQRIADALPVLISFVGPDQRYEFVNATYERWFGIPKAEILGKPVKDVLGAEAFARAAPHLESALSGVPSSYEGQLPYLHGGTRSVQATYLPDLDPRSGELAGYIGLVSDISDRRRLEVQRASAARRADKLLKITAAVADAVTSLQVFEAIVDHVAEGIQASSVGLWLLDAKDNVVRLARGTGYSDQAMRQLERLPLDTAPSLPLLDALKTGTPVWIPSQAVLFERYPHLRSLASVGRSYRIACLPLSADQHVVGVLAITIEEPGDADDEERDFLLLVARYASQAILRLHLLEAEQQSRRDATAAAGRLGILNRVSRALAETDLALDRRLPGVATELSGVLDSCVNIVLLKESGVLHLAAVHHPVPEANALLQQLAAAAPIRVGEGITGSIAATGQGGLIESTDASLIAERAAPAYRDFLRRFPMYATMGVPLRVRGRIIGVVTATRVRAGQTYTADDVQLLEELGQRASVGIENSRLYEQAVDARSRAEQLYRFAQAVVEADGVEVVFDAAFVAIERALGARRAAILRLDSAGSMRFKAWRGLSDAYRSAVEGHNPWRADDAAPAPVLVADAQNEPTLSAYRELFQRECIGALAFVPLTSAGRLLGKFMVYYDTPHTFTRADVETAHAIANHLASVTVRYETVTALEETVRNNELLAGVLAHDLRNPLAAIMTAAHLLLANDHDDGLSPWSAKALRKILASGGRMKAMIEQLLDFTRARSGGGIGIDPKPANLAELATQAVDELELTHPSWRLERRVVGDPNGAWDPDRMLQVISNLASNAGQHGRAGGSILVLVDGSQPEHVMLSVHNEGVIAAVKPQELFDPFRSFGQPRRQSSGLGLGLFIVREIVRAHGGSVEAVSSEADGTSFIARLPRRPG